jgi:hypothetical protein
MDYVHRENDQEYGDDNDQTNGTAHNAGHSQTPTIGAQSFDGPAPHDADNQSRKGHRRQEGEPETRQDEADDDNSGGRQSSLRWRCHETLWLVQVVSPSLVSVTEQ